MGRAASRPDGDFLLLMSIEEQSIEHGAEEMKDRSYISAVFIRTNTDSKEVTVFSSLSPQSQHSAAFEMADAGNPSPEVILQRVRNELQTQMMQGTTNS